MTIATQAYDGGAYIIPTQEIIKGLITDLSTLTFADYDLTELADYAIEAIKNKGKMQDNMYFYSERLGTHYAYRNTYPGLEVEVTNSAKLLGKYWVTFTMKLFDVLANYDLWDINGILNYRFLSFIDMFDIVISRLPVETMPLTYDTIIAADNNRKAALYGNTAA